MPPPRCPLARYRRYRRRQLSGRPGRRSYSLERACYQSTPAQRSRNNARHRIRRRLMQQGLVALHDGIQIHHRNGDALDNRARNIVLVSSIAHRRLHGK